MTTIHVDIDIYLYEAEFLIIAPSWGNLFTHVYFWLFLPLFINGTASGLTPSWSQLILKILINFLLVLIFPPSMFIDSTTPQNIIINIDMMKTPF